MLLVNFPMVRSSLKNVEVTKQISERKATRGNTFPYRLNVKKTYIRSFLLGVYILSWSYDKFSGASTSRFTHETSAVFCFFSLSYLNCRSLNLRSSDVRFQEVSALYLNPLRFKDTALFYLNAGISFHSLNGARWWYVWYAFYKKLSDKYDIDKLKIFRGYSKWDGVKCTLVLFLAWLFNANGDLIRNGYLIHNG